MFNKTAFYSKADHPRIRAVRVRHFGYPTRPVPVLLYPYPTRTRDTVPVPVLVSAGKNTRLPVSRL